MSDSVALERLPGELWWGGAVADGDDMPYDSRFGRDLSIWLGDNQGSPLLLSSLGRHVWCDDPISFSFEGNLLRVTSAGGPVVVGSGGSSLRDAFRAASTAYFPATGTSPDPRMFTTPQYNTWIELVYDQTQQRILDYAHAIIDNGYPPGVLMIDDNWQEDYGVWNFHPARFPDPHTLINQLHDLGFTIMLWTCPFISPDSPTFRTLEHHQLLLRDHTGTTAIRRWWNGYSALLDLTNPHTTTWLHHQLTNLQTRYRIDGFKFDAGDPRFYRDTDQPHTPTTPNQHTQTWADIGLNYPLNEYRACWKHAGQPLAQRQTDLDPTWSRLGLGSIVAWGIAQGLLGYAFNCPDMIGGGLASQFELVSYVADSERFVRWAQAAALFPMMQFSLAPWRVLTESENAIVREAISIRERLAPYLCGLVEHAATTGEPILRSMEYVFPHQGYARITDQFMLGNDILVAPVLEKVRAPAPSLFRQASGNGTTRRFSPGQRSSRSMPPWSRCPGSSA